MAVGRLSVKVGKVGKAAPHAAYISRLGKYADRLNRGERLEATGTGNMPAWAQHNPLHFWEAADQNERSNGSTYREQELALPRELNPDQRRKLVEDWIRQEIGSNYAYQYAIHNPNASDGKEQPHAHLMFSERRLDGIERDPEQFFKRYNSKHPERGGARKDNTGKDHATRKEEIKAQRDRWSVLVNEHLQRAGCDDFIDMRSYKDQGLDIQPEKKMLPSEWRNPAKRAEVLEFRQTRADLIKARQELNLMVPNMKKALLVARQKQNARATPEMIKREYEKHLNQAEKWLEDERQRRVDAYTAAHKAWADLKEPQEADYCKKVPLTNTRILLPWAEARYNADLREYSRKEQDLRYARIDAERNQREPLPSPFRLADQQFAKASPELYQEWQRLKELEEQQAKTERDKLHEQRQQQRNNRGNGYSR